MKKILFALLLISTFLSCEKDDPQVPDGPTVDPESGVFVVNEGSFQAGNASLGYYDFSTANYIEKVFQNKNGRILGDVFQSMSVIGDVAYLVLNNSNKVEVMHLTGFESLATIDTFSSPRYLLPVNANKAYLSDLFAKTIYTIDLKTLEKTGSIPMTSSWTESMVLHQNQVFVSAPSSWGQAPSKYVYTIDTDLDILADSIEVGYDPTLMVKDKNNNIWVYCRGSQDENAYGGLFLINTSNMQVEKSLLFEDFDAPFAPELTLNGTKDTLFYTKTDVFSLSIEANELPSTPLIEAEGKTIYALGVAPQSGKIFISDATSFQQAGYVYRYDKEGKLLGSFVAGIGPSDFLFY